VISLRRLLALESILTRSQEQARQLWNRLSTDRTALVPGLACDPSVMPPFSTMQISSVALQQACLEMCESSTGDARLIFDLGRSPRQDEDGNWVIRWLLWRTRPKHPPGVRDAERDQDFAEECLEAREAITRGKFCGVATGDIGSPEGAAHEPKSQRNYWDPARDL
jgi:hypothetical protein